MEFSPTLNPIANKIKENNLLPQTFHMDLLLLFTLSDLRKQEEHGELLQPLIFVLLVLCSVLLYFVVSLMDPGFVESDEEEKVNHSVNLNHS